MRPNVKFWRGGGNVVIKGGIVLLALLSPVHLAIAAPSATEVCNNVAQKAGRTLWSSVRESGDAMFCRKSWVPGGPDELAACGLWTQTHLFSNKLKNLWNASFAKADAGWATWGPRGICVDWEEGTIQGGFKRTYFGAGIAYSASTIEVVKEGGKAEAFITVCTLDYDGKVVAKQQKSFPNGQGGEGTAVTFTLQHKDNRILGVVVDTPVQVRGNTFEYRARVLTEPIRNNLPAVQGIADLHVHQMVHLTFGGRMYWGESIGPEETALAKEEINPSGSGFDLTNPEELLKQLATPGASLDANVLFTVIGGKVSDEGFWKYGGEGFPSYRDWPHHADRSHQQAHLSWLKEAHERNKESNANLKLVVVSLVNNNILCSVAQTFDKFGNVPIRDAHGRITGWESKAWGCSDHENVLRQLLAMHAIEKANPWYRIAMTPWHARQIIADGDLAVIVSMETDKPLSSEGNNYSNWEDQLDAYRAMGLSTMQIVHESDSKFCGAAVHRGMMGWLQLVHWPLKTIDDLFDKDKGKFDVDEHGYNKLGITEAGKQLVDAMVKRHMPIDLAHGSQRCRKDIMARVGTDYGLYDSHTKFGRLLGGHVAEREKEFVVMESIVPDYKKHKVLIGLRTASIDVKDAPSNDPHKKVDNTCPGSARSLAQMVQYAADLGIPFAYGTDFNTGVSQLGPRFGGKGVRCWAGRQDLKDTIDPRKTSESEGPRPARANQIKPIAGANYYTHGLATIGWLPELTIDLLENLHTPGAEKLLGGAEAFLQMWERTYPPAQALPVSDPGGNTVALGGACTAGDQCKSGRCTGVAGAQGVCVCNEDSDCGTGRYCDAGADLTQNRCALLKNDNEACAVVGGGHQCKGGHCMFGRCYTQNAVAMGGLCYADAACEKGKCSAIDGFAGTCVCQEDADCGAGYWCDKGFDTTKNACKAKLNSGAICGTVGEMNVGHRCKSGDCKIAGLSQHLKCK